MRCQSCQQNPATVHQMVAEYGPDGNQEIREVHLCSTCAKADGVPVPAAPAFPAMIGMLGKALLSQAAATTDPSTACPACGWTLRDFRQTSRFGCPEDYEFFGKYVEEVLEQIHGQTEHLVPQEDAEGADLRHALQDAIKREDYEEAARLRDHLEKLDSPLENPGIMD